MIRLLAVLVLAGGWLSSQKANAFVSLVGYQSISSDGSQIRLHGSGFSSVTNIKYVWDGSTRITSAFLLETDNTLSFQMPVLSSGFVRGAFFNDCYVILYSPEGVVVGDNYGLQIVNNTQSFSGGARPLFVQSGGDVSGSAGAVSLFAKSGARVRFTTTGAFHATYETGAIVNNPTLGGMIREEVPRIDYVALQQVPEPSSLSLLLAGGAVLMAGRRRRV
jgi:hypothetical protein